MGRQFQIGDRVRIIKPDSRNYGAETSVLRARFYQSNSVSGWSSFQGYEVDIPNREWGHNGYRPEHLKLIYDGDEPSTWEDCIWKPDLVTVNG